MARIYEVEELVRSLVGQPLGVILSRLDAAAGVHDDWLRRPRSQRDLFEGTADYSQFAKGALFFLVHAPGQVPGGVSAEEFGKLRPLVVDMSARGIAHPKVTAWLSA